MFVNHSMSVDSLSAACSNKLSSLEHLLSQSLNRGNLDRQRSIAEDAEILRNEAEALLIQLEGELHNISSVVSKNKAAGNIAKLYKSFYKLDEQLYSRKNELKKLEKRKELMESSNSAVTTGRNGSQERHYDSDFLRETKAKAKKTEEAMLQSRRLLTDALEIGDGVLDNLEEQRETLLDAAERVEDTGSLAAQSREILRRMANRTLFNKLFLYFVILCLLVSIALVLYFLYIKKH